MEININADAKNIQLETSGDDAILIRIGRPARHDVLWMAEIKLDRPKVDRLIKFLEDWSCRHEFQVGDKVYILNDGMPGSIFSYLGDETYLVDFGSFGILEYDANSLILVSEAEAQEAK